MARPKVVLHGIASLDGKLTLGPDRLLLPWGSSAEDLRRWQELAGESTEVLDWLKSLHKAEVELVGSEAFVTGGSGMADLPPVDGEPQLLYEDFLPEAVVQAPGRTSWFAVVDSRGRVRWGMKEADGAHLLVLACQRSPAPYLAFLRASRIPYLLAGDARVDLALALSKLKERLNVSCLLCTSPGKLGAALLDAGLVDEINVEVFPAIIGGVETPSLFRTSEPAPGGPPLHLVLVSAQVQTNGRLWLRYAIKNRGD